MNYKVRLDIFEGPFDLLVYLIERSKMNIYDIQISEITSQYIEYVQKMQSLDIELAQDFMVLAAELIQIKTRMLLPAEKVKEGEEVFTEDPRSDLVRRLVEYKQFKEMGIFLDQQAELNSHIHPKPAEDLEGYMGEPEEIIKGSLTEFAQAFMDFILKKQRLEEMHKIYERIERQKMSMENRINQVVEILKKKQKTSFSELIEGDHTNFNKVITFMSILELLRERSITAEQKKRYGDILIRKAEASND
ncbi:MAG: segregation/condensation protein A [Firmicutes bacterium]|nr:segregation/condensation protein A [Bacillota bacterium]